MMHLKTVFHFLGGLQFALLLITSTAAFAIAGTFIESVTDSHQYAALFIYGSPLFSLLLWGYFLNILISALRRYPFTTRHIPFLITHLGMLMILAGTYIKIHVGIQGTMTILEGGGSDQIFLADRHALYVQNKDSTSPEIYTFKENFPHYSTLQPLNSTLIPDEKPLSITLLEYAPHSQERLESWIKGNVLSLFGVRPLPVFQLSEPELEIPSFFRVQLPQSNEPTWNVIAVRTDDIPAVVEKAYIQSVSVIFRESASNQELFVHPLNTLLKTPIETPYGLLTTHLQFIWAPEGNFLSPTLHLHLSNEKEKGKITIALDGDKSLLNQYTLPLLGKEKLSIDLSSIPSLVFLQDTSNDISLFAFNKNGQVIFSSSKQGDLEGIMAYNDGFLGYSQEIKLNSMEYSPSRQERELTLLSTLKAKLQQETSAIENLAAPLQLLHHACQACQQDFPKITAAFLDQWNKQGGWLCSEKPLSEDVEKALNLIDWQKVPPGIPQEAYRGCYWNVKLFEQLDPLLRNKEGNLITILNKLNFPSFLQMNLEICPLENWPHLLQAITLNLFSTAHHLPEIAFEKSTSPAQLLSAYFRAYGIHLSQMSTLDVVEKPLILESMLSRQHQFLSPGKKLENNTPCVALRFSKDNQQEEIILSYDKMGSRFKWPIFNGEYLVCFQPLCQKIPYRLRLREARQINYANSQQPYSYESDLIITDKNKNQISEHSISMNNVYETWDGYRFYLSHISPADKGGIKRVQIVVNKDPAKYLITYPGALIMTLGILLLFFKKNKK